MVLNHQLLSQLELWGSFTFPGQCAVTEDFLYAYLCQILKRN